MLFNKISGAILAVVLAIMALATFSDVVFGKAHHGGHHEDDEHSLNEKIAETFSYYIEVSDGGEGAAEEEEVFDLGAMLAAADVSKGERSFKAKCSSCHTIEDGGANGTGPNLHDVVGRPVASHAGFGYSSAMQAHAAERPEWDYQHLNDFLMNPKGVVSGTAMAFAGLRRDPERADVIAYLASVNAAAPAFPEPLPEEAEGEEEGEAAEGEATEVSADESEAVDGDITATVEGAADETTAAVEEVGVEIEETAGEAAEAVEDAAGEAEETAEEAEEATEE